MTFEEEDFITRKETKKTRRLLSKTDRSKYKESDLAKRETKLRAQHQEKLKGKSLVQGRVIDILPEEVVVEVAREVAGEMAVEVAGEVAVELMRCHLGGAVKQEQRRVTSLLVVGDFVLLDGMRIVAIEERKSTLTRLDPFHKTKEQTLAANIDQAIITASVSSPPLSPAFLDRMMIAARKGGMESIIVLNKIDLLEKNDFAHEVMAAYRSLGIPLIPMSAKTEEGLSELKKTITGKVSLFAGESGVGKSTLINTLTGLSLATAQVTRKTKRGTHTTRRARFLPLSCGGWCVDTPGIQSLSLHHLDRQDLLEHFFEITEMGQSCKFLSCTHTHEPGCNVLLKLQEHQLFPFRYESYVQLLNDV